MPDDLSFLNKDVKRQQEIAQEALEEAKRLDELLQSKDVPEALKPKLEKTKQSLLRVARDLATNATLTSNSAISALSITLK